MTPCPKVGGETGIALGKLLLPLDARPKGFASGSTAQIAPRTYFVSHCQIGFGGPKFINLIES
jgi:hypothetical protein